MQTSVNVLKACSCFFVSQFANSLHPESIFAVTLFFKEYEFNRLIKISIVLLNQEQRVTVVEKCFVIISVETTRIISGIEKGFCNYVL